MSIAPAPCPRSWRSSIAICAARPRRRQPPEWAPCHTRWHTRGYPDSSPRALDARTGAARIPCAWHVKNFTENAVMTETIHEIAQQNRSRLRTPYYLLDETRLLRNL